LKQEFLFFLSETASSCLFDGGVLVVQLTSGQLVCCLFFLKSLATTTQVLLLHSPSPRPTESVLIPELLAEELHSLFVLGGLGT
jgi:hypothetical protein